MARGRPTTDEFKRLKPLLNQDERAQFVSALYYNDVHAHRRTLAEMAASVKDWETVEPQCSFDSDFAADFANSRFGFLCCKFMCCMIEYRRFQKSQ